jgi:hypothetical protein
VAQGLAFVARITSAFFFITCVVYLGIEPAPLVRQELFDPGKEKREEEMERKEEVESEEENANKGVAEASGPEKGFLSVFDYQRWNRPLRYINNEKNEMAVRTEISQYFFHICKSDGKEKIAFTYPPSLSIFLQMLKERVRVWESTIKKTLSNDNDNEFYNYWVYSNNRKGNKISKEFRNRLEALDNKSLLRDILETRTRLCNDSNDDSENNEDSENKYFYFPKTRTRLCNISKVCNISKEFRNRIEALIIEALDKRSLFRNINLEKEITLERKEKDEDEDEKRKKEQEEDEAQYQNWPNEAKPFLAARDAIWAEENEFFRKRNEKIRQEGVARKDPSSFPLLDDLDDELAEAEDKEKGKYGPCDIHAPIVVVEPKGVWEKLQDLTTIKVPVYVQIVIIIILLYYKD